jgi:hypothetical protein
VYYIAIIADLDVVASNEVVQALVEFPVFKREVIGDR